ncbi:MAG: hypothetical protein JWL70_1230 [Acidimicrobiia bacterium]|nr:hypothetical protein [Acidimicrobiia bacterium]
MTAAGETMPLVEVRRALRAALSRRSEPVLVIDDQFVPAVALWASALQYLRQERAGGLAGQDAVTPLATSELDRVRLAVAAAWSGELALPAWDRPSPRRAALVVATPWDADGGAARLVLALLSGSAVIVRPDPAAFDAVLEALVHWRPWRAEITDQQLAWLRCRPEGREALSGFGHLLVVASAPVPSASWPVQRIS